MKIVSMPTKFREINRSVFLRAIKDRFEVNPVVALLGPRQCGKTTLARAYLEHWIEPGIERLWTKANYFDLENYQDLQRLADPLLTLKTLRGLIVIDEIQRRPDLFETLRVLVDNQEHQQQYLILGSASRELIRQSSESLAGRISYLELTPFNLSEVKDESQLWLRGGFPAAYLAKNDLQSMIWRRDYIRTYLEQDIPNLGIKIPTENLRRFWYMLAHYHTGQLNSSELGRALNLTHNTVKNYIDILAGTFMVRQLPAWYANLSKRQVKAPKIFIRDSGIFHALIGIENQEQLLLNPKIGASWEGWVTQEIIQLHQAIEGEYFYWGIHEQAELDLLLIKNGKRLGFEVKYSAAPSLTKSMRIALEDLELDALTVICPGEIAYLLTDRIEVIGLQTYLANNSEFDG